MLIPKKIRYRFIERDKFVGIKPVDMLMNPNVKLGFGKEEHCLSVGDIGT